MRTLFSAILLLWGLSSFAQTTITGKVVDENNTPVPGANIVITGKTIGTTSDFDGKFTLTTSEVPPFNLTVSSIGYATTTVAVTANNQELNIVLNSEETLLDEIVVSASRTPERIFESPVSVERFGIKEIKNTASPSFYDGLENLKGVDLNTNSLTFKSINTRGFATFANTRFVQLVDGMDNSSPALNFVIGNIVGINENDVQSVELLPGASSALYGANAFNGILFLRSKSPFDVQGISTYGKTGITSQEAAGDNVFYDFGFRAAHAFSDKFAVKVNFSYLSGRDWFAVNEVDVNNPGATRADPGFDGLNIYGDEVATNLRGVADALESQGLIPAGAANLVPSETVSRTGYRERDLTQYNAESIKTDLTLVYRPFADDFEIIYNGRIGQGSTIYQGANRYSLNNFTLQQHKLEFRNKNFFLRGYVTSESAGDTYDTRFTGININRAYSDDQTWFGEYTGAFIQTILAGGTNDQAHAAGRQFADRNRLIPGTPEFQEAFDRVTSDPDLLTGSRFQDNTKLYHVDANYNFTHLTSNFAEIQVGGSFREYQLNSAGTIFTDFDGPIIYSEVGAYTQIQKKLADERLKLTGSVRYDKNQLFDGFFSPRFSVGYTVGEERNHNIRASVQTGFRNPTTQDLYIGLDVGAAFLVGSAEGNPARFERTRTLSGVGQLINGGQQTVTFDGSGAYENSFTATSALLFAQTQNPADLQIANPNPVEPEQVTSFEVGYRGQLNDKRIIVDLSAYYNSYKDFISTENTIVPLYGNVNLSDATDLGQGPIPNAVIALANGDTQVIQAYTNSEADINSYGATIGVDAKVLGNFDLGVNYTFAEFDFDQASDPDFRPGFNTPKHKVKASFGNTELFKNFGFNVSWRWSDSYFWQASFADGNVPAYNVVDAQLSYNIPKLESAIKIGASNLLNEEYFTAFGTGLVGAQYFISWTYRP
ncbi:TonB-dependent receptor plug domain-containing protein [Leptobacterium flavescens]|uniref:TonB-dependent receptor plug domain-containing protein n=1 Tax=Leptobacterium flavescens TaxID=472055 RepID=A0A6P0UPR0_9FLAO|nr:TonB-dependent receptor [Leptobacterium flavescens]NER14492.1 TonB-dependent receptor plug domain-containing protein [Leptobacterium flavescens]